MKNLVRDEGTFWREKRKILQKRKGKLHRERRERHEASRDRHKWYKNL